MIECGVRPYDCSAEPCKGSTTNDVHQKNCFLTPESSQNKLFRCKIIHNSLSLTHPHPKRLTSFINVPKNKNFICLFLLSQFLKIYDFMSSSNFSYLLFLLLAYMAVLWTGEFVLLIPSGPHIFYIFFPYANETLFFFLYLILQFITVTNC